MGWAQQTRALAGRWRLGLTYALTGIVASGCASGLPGDEYNTFGELGDEIEGGEGETTSGDGDGDGDGDSTSGDGDGDGDPTSGDGDGDPTSGDGDGDGDGDTTGDGDGDGDTGDGDGDTGGDECMVNADCDLPNMTATCSDGYCTGHTCVDPWADCNQDMLDGCEVPVDVPHQCSAQGLDPNNGCWTAYCGQSGDADATNFDGFYCVDCATCRSPQVGQCQWCDHASGTFFPADVCACGGFEDAVCLL